LLQPRLPQSLLSLSQSLFSLSQSLFSLLSYAVIVEEKAIPVEIIEIV
jgi:hypothetical protein